MELSSYDLSFFLTKKVELKKKPTGKTILVIRLLLNKGPELEIQLHLIPLSRFPTLAVFRFRFDSGGLLNVQVPPQTNQISSWPGM